MLLSISRLSESPIWQLQRTAYARLGVESWAKGRVPFQMTNNARLAAQYADIACSLFPQGSFTVLELGGGCGKFAFLLLNELIRRKIPKIRYLLTDAAKKNIAFWNEHPRLLPWINQGILQISVFDPLSESFPHADLIIGNYLFDSIPQDLFRVEKGVLFEGLASLHAEVESPDWDDPALLPKLRIEYAFRKVEENPYPASPAMWSVLEEYSQQFDDFSFLFPIGALRTLQNISSSQNDFLFLAADRGPCFAKDLNRVSLIPSLHGSAFSFPVNFHAIGRYMERIGETVLFSQSHEADFSVALMSRKPTVAKQCFEAQVFGPLNTEAIDFAGILQRLEEANWDATLFFSFFDRIEEWFGQVGNGAKKEMLEGMHRVKERFFPLFREEGVLLERLGLFFRSLGDEEEAIAHFALAASCHALPRQDDSVRAFIKAHPPSGDVLLIGGEEEAFERAAGISSGSLDLSQASRRVKSLVSISWGEPIEELGTFDTVFLFPPRVVAQSKKPDFVRDIEKRFSLDAIHYSDADIEAFFSASGSGTDPKHVLHFFVELERKKNISREQLERIAKRLGEEVPQEEDRFFEILMVCLRRHMKPGSILRAFISGIATYDDARFFEEVVVDPYLETEEIVDPQGVWVMVQK